MVSYYVKSATTSWTCSNGATDLVRTRLGESKADRVKGFQPIFLTGRDSWLFKEKGKQHVLLIKVHLIASKHLFKSAADKYFNFDGYFFLLNVMRKLRLSFNHALQEP